ncbi:hypothetical protein Nepgr_003834 [Nepenthes gracilis]|uniref:Uncharacterized protein n=1 Tax=Nepenthes gracilis TaxID=150966 RepID=A0AAD3XEE6_NEPGR|nr:hypothetical protein Nepgr_003834 [Nepenthes gracilis]
MLLEVADPIDCPGCDLGQCAVWQWQLNLVDMSLLCWYVVWNVRPVLNRSRLLMPINESWLNYNFLDSYGSEDSVAVLGAFLTGVVYCLVWTALLVFLLMLETFAGVEAGQCYSCLNVDGLLSLLQ